MTDCRSCRDCNDRCCPGPDHSTPERRKRSAVRKALHASPPAKEWAVTLRYTLEETFHVRAGDREEARRLAENMWTSSPRASLYDMEFIDAEEAE